MQHACQSCKYGWDNEAQKGENAEAPVAHCYTQR